MRKFFLTLQVLVLALSGYARAYSDYSDWGGMYATGDYNLYSFGTSVYDIIDYTYIQSNWGGSCGSLMTACGSCYDSASLYPQTTGTEYTLMGITNQLWTILAGMNNGSYPSQTYPPQTYPPQTYPPMTYPPQTYPPQTYPPMTYPPVTTYPPQTYPPQTYPPMTYPPVTYPPSYPPVTTYPPVNPPPSIPPYGGCDNIIVPCPAGPITPAPNPGGGTTPVPSPVPVPAPVVTTTTTQPVPNSPVTNRIPRTATH